jgi:bifunctional oligoribonuclease and PAP phosphatase NrnA
MPRLFLLFCIMDVTLDQVYSVFENNSSFVITTHINPDGDAIGSEVALAAFLSNSGKDVLIVNESETPANLKFLASLHPIAHFSEMKDTDRILISDVFIALDANQTSRFQAVWDVVKKGKSYKLCIDHHLSRENFADGFFVDEKASATGEIIYQLLASKDRSAISTPIADALYAAIMTDTGSFRFPSTTSGVHKIISDLIDRGANPSLLYQKIFEEGPVNKLLLLGKALESLHVAHQGAVAYIILRQSAFTETGTTEEDTDNIINFTLTIGGVKIGMMFTEFPNSIKVSFRSKGQIPVNKLAQEFGGNGHLNAAGARLTNLPLDDIVNKVVERSKQYIEHSR